MTFLYKQRTGQEFRLKTGTAEWGGWFQGSHELRYQRSPDLRLLQCGSDELGCNFAGPLLLLVSGFPRSPSTPNQDSDKILRSLARDMLEEICLDHWRGSFVALLVLPGIDAVICARDRVGGRTAYYCRKAESLAISSGAHLLAHETGRTRENPSYLARHFGLSRFKPIGDTAFQDIEEILPGQRLSFNDGKLSNGRPPVEMLEMSNARPVERARDFGDCFATAVERTLPRSGEAGVMLSGGLDSAPAACIAAQALRAQGRRLHAVSWRLPGFPDCDEIRWIRMVSQHAGIRLHEFDGTAYPAFSSLHPSAVHPDSPAFNAFRPLINACYRMAADLGIHVLLNAHAGDAVYPSPAVILVDLRNRRRWRQLLIESARQVYRSPMRIRRNRAFRQLVRTMIGRTAPASAPAWLTDDARSHFEAFEYAGWPPEAAAHSVPDYARRLLGLGLGSGVAREAAFSNRFEISRRDPFYDLDLLQFMLATPPSTALAEGHEKWIMREAMRNILPEPVRIKPRTGLLGSFFDTGFEQHLASIRERLMDDRAWSKWVRRSVVEKALARESSGRERMVATACLGYVLWRERIREPHDFGSGQD